MHVDSHNLSLSDWANNARTSQSRIYSVREYKSLLAADAMKMSLKHTSE